MELKIVKSEMRLHPAYYSPQKGYLVEIILPLTQSVDGSEEDLAQKLGTALVESIKKYHHSDDTV